jgi:diguanylate cyclase (GGDEF)-like protein
MKRILLLTSYSLTIVVLLFFSILGKFLLTPGTITIVIGSILSLLLLLLVYILLKWNLTLNVLLWMPIFAIIANLSVQLTGGFPHSIFIPLYFFLIVVVILKSEIAGIILCLSLIVIPEVSSALLNEQMDVNFVVTMSLYLLVSVLIAYFIGILKSKKKNIETRLNELEKSTSVLATPVSTDDENELFESFKHIKNGVDLKASEKMKEFIEPILDTVSQSVSSHSSAIFLKDEKRDVFFLFLIKSHSAYINSNAEITKNMGTYNWVIKEKEPLLNTQFLVDSSMLGYYTRDEDVRSIIIIPLIEESNLIGLLVCDNKEENTFNWETKEKLKVFGNLIVSTVTLFKKIYHSQKAVYNFLTLDKITKEVSKDLETDNVLKNLSDIAQQAFKFDLLVLIRCEDGKKPMIFKTIPSEGFDLVGTTVSIDSSLAGFVIKNNMLIIKKQKIDTPYFFSGENKLEIYRSFFGVPMRKDEKVVGELALLSRNRAHFTEEDKEPIKFLADLVYVALEKAKLFEETKALSIHDGLTGAFNHRYFQEKLLEEIKRAERSKSSPFSLLMFDIDNFKSFNDDYGHQIGDSVLKHISEVVKKNIREIDIFARYGGEEFILLLPNTEKEGAVSVAEKLRKLIAINPLVTKKKNYFITVSVGCSVFPSDGEDKNTLIKRADEALYKAKQDGKNLVRTAE